MPQNALDMQRRSLIRDAHFHLILAVARLFLISYICCAKNNCWTRLFYAFNSGISICHENLPDSYTKCGSDYIALAADPIALTASLSRGEISLNSAAAKVYWDARDPRRRFILHFLRLLFKL
jgi:hypothetical protein